MDVARYVGLPFGRGACEVTCWSLVKLVYAEVLGIALPEYGDIAPRDLVRVAQHMAAAAAETCWVAPAVPQSGDVVLMRSARGGQEVCHVGLLVWSAAVQGAVLHAEEATGSVLVPAAHYTVRGRIAGYRRFRG